MSPTEAAKLLDLPPDSTSEQIEARFQELRAKLEDRIAKAPTPGLKEKYRQSLTDITQAFEALALAADSSALPVLQRQRTDANAEKTPSGTPPDSGFRPQVSGLPAQKPKASSGKEFLVVAVIAVALLGFGGWWVMKNRAEERHRAEVVAAEKLEAEKQAAAARAKEIADKERAAAAEKAESARREQLALRLRTQLAEYNIALDALLRAEQEADRELTELKAEERSLAREAKGAQTPELRAANAHTQAQEAYLKWIRDHVATSPARMQRAKLDELMGAKAYDDAAAAVDTYASSLKQLQTDIATQRRDLLTLTGALALTAEPAEVDFVLRDIYGRTREGRTPADLNDVPFGATTVTFSRPGWPKQERRVVVARNGTASARADLVGGALELASTPFATDYVVSGQGRTDQGRTPARFAELPAGDYSVRFSRAGWPDQTKTVSIPRAGTAALAAEFAAPGSAKFESTPSGAQVTLNGRVVGHTPVVVSDLPAGPVRAELTLADYRPLTVEGTVEFAKQTLIPATLRSATLTPEEAFAKLAEDAKGTWALSYHNIIAGNQRLYLRFTPGSRKVVFEQTGFGGSVRTLTMVEYDAANRIVLLAFSGLDALNGKQAIRLEGDVLRWGTDNTLAKSWEFRRE